MQAHCGPSRSRLDSIHITSDLEAEPLIQPELLQLLQPELLQLRIVDLSPLRDLNPGSLHDIRTRCNRQPEVETGAS
jgi:hypothetical protein